MYPKLTSELSHKSICLQGAIEASKILGMKTMGAGEGVRYSRLQEVVVIVVVRVGCTSSWRDMTIASVCCTSRSGLTSSTSSTSSTSDSGGRT